MYSFTKTTPWLWKEHSRTERDILQERMGPGLAHRKGPGLREVVRNNLKMLLRRPRADVHLFGES